MAQPGAAGIEDSSSSIHICMLLRCALHGEQALIGLAAQLQPGT